MPCIALQELKARCRGLGAHRRGADGPGQGAHSRWSALHYDRIQNAAVGLGETWRRSKEKRGCGGRPLRPEVTPSRRLHGGLAGLRHAVPQDLERVSVVHCQDEGSPHHLNRDSSRVLPPNTGQACPTTTTRRGGDPAPYALTLGDGLLRILARVTDFPLTYMTSSSR